MTDRGKLVVDCNVTIVANQKSEHASIKCTLACINFLERCRSLNLALDSAGLIMREYSSHLNYSGSPGVGDMFFKYLHDNQFCQERISLVDLTPIEDESRTFEELPKNELDPSDRKYLATALISRSEIVNATDSDWAEQKALTDDLGVNVIQLCEECKPA
ncbi:hypothetical protein [Gallaecimonas sp. GXIMD4217]|uniref:hypothetical protein n=1 Tax=Gallaecimonas sp. GXIMD4217 TaxID=3131927 RepID=UPI00311ADE92